MGQPVKVERRAVEHDLAILREKAKLQQFMLETYRAKAVSERRLVTEFLTFSGFLSNDPKFPYDAAYRQWSKDHQAQAEAQENIFTVELAQIKSQIAIREAMLSEAQKNIVVPGAFQQ